MRPDLVVVPSPELDLLLCVSQIDKPIRLEAFAAKLAVEALDVPVLGRLAGSDEVQLHAPLEGPSIKSLRDELRSVVDANAFGVTAGGPACLLRALRTDMSAATAAVPASSSP